MSGFFGGQTYYYSIIKNYIGAIGSLFSGFSIQRFDKAGNVINVIKVPCIFGQKQKFYQRLVADPNAGNVNPEEQNQNPVSMVVPIISFEIGSDFTYDTVRKLNSLGYIVSSIGESDPPTQLKTVYQAVPFIFPFTLSIATSNLEDNLILIEQILPCFTPTYSFTIKETPMQLSRDIVIKREAISLQDNPYGDLKSDERLVITEIGFSLYGQLYGPIVEKPLITSVDINTYFDQVGVNLSQIDAYSNNFTNEDPNAFATPVDTYTDEQSIKDLNITNPVESDTITTQ